MERHFFMISRALNARKRKIFALFFALAASIGLSYALTPKGTDVWDDATKTLTVNSNPQDDYYNDQGEIKRLVISSTVTEIGEQAFSSNYNLQEVIAYDGLQVIDQSAFFSCPNLESVILPSTLREVRYSAFSYCDNLKYVTINAPSLEEYQEYAFDDTHADLKIYVPAESVATYKSNWSAYADKIVAIGSDEPAAPAATEVTITNNDFPGMDVSFTKDGVTVSADWIDNMNSGNLVGPGSFSTTLGNFTKIEVNAGEVLQLGEGWSGNSERQTWTGNASSVPFSGEIYGVGHGITIMFTIEAAAPAKPTLTLSDKVSILGMPIAGITDLGNNNYEIEPGTQFQIQAAAAPEHYSFVGWSDLASTDPNYSANPRTITITGDSTIKPLYALEAFTITLTSNDTTMGKVTLRAGSGGGEDGDMSIANNADLEGANTSRNIAVGADGSIHVVYKSTEDQSVKYIKSIDGVTFTEPVTVANGAKECEVAVSSNGKVYVSYYVENDGGYIAYSADGTSFTSVMVDYNGASLHLATDGDYVYAVNKPGTNFYYSSDGGQTYNMHSDWSEYMFSDVMVDPLTHNVVVIKDMPEVVVRYSTDHGATFTEEAPVMVQGGNDQLAIFFSTATMGDGKVYMAGADAFVAIINYMTATCTKTDVNSTQNRSLCADPVGNVIVGVEQGEYLYYQLSTNSAVSFGENVLVSNGSGANAALNYHDGTLLYLFTKDNKLYLATRTGIVPTESVVDNGDGTYAVQYGTEVTFTAKAKPGYHVESWSNAVEVNDNIVATQTLEVNSAMTIGATFAANPILTIATNDSTKGIVSLGGAGQGEPITVRWNNSDISGSGNSFTKDGVTITCGDINWDYPDFYGNGTFTTDLGNFTKIEVTADMCEMDGAGWTYDADNMTWTGNATSVSFNGGMYIISSIVFTIEPAAPATEGIIDLGGGQYSVVPGTELTFVAQPAEEHYLVSWNGEAATSDTLKLTMNGELTVNANFAHVPYIYTLPEGVSIVEPMPAGITAKGEGVYEIVEGTEFRIQATVPEHHSFDHWADLTEEDAMYAANPRTIVAGENLTIEPIFAIDTYTLTLATNDSTKGVVSVIGAGSGAGAGVGEMISLSEKQTENPVMGEYFQVAGEGVNYEGRIIGRSDDYQLTISSQNGEKLDFIILKVSSKGLWSGYTVSSTAGDVEDLLDNFTIRVSNINATSVTISRSGTTGNPTGYIIVSSVYVNEEIPLRFDITDNEFPNSGNVLTGNGVTLTAGSFDLAHPQIVGGGTFTTDLGNFTKIEIYSMGFSEFSGEGWTEEGDYERIWTGNASSVSFGGAVLGEGGGSIYISYTIALAPAASGIVDNGDGTYTVDYGTELTFVAKPAEGFMLESWSNGAAVTGDTLKLTMTEELSLTANFKHIPATITLPEGVNIVEPMPAGITSKGEGVYEVEYGTEFQISADSIPAHHHFDHWADLVDSAAMYAANPRTIVAGENLTIEPIFAIDTYTLTLATNDSTKGIVSLEGAGQGGEPEPSAQLIVPESWSSEVGVTITADDLPGFVASTEEAVKALPVPTEGSVFVIYNFKEEVDPSGGAGNASVEAVTFENGEYVRTTSSPVDHANASYYSNQGMIFLYTTAAGQAGQGGEGGEGEEQEGEPVAITIGDLTTAQVSDYLPACTMTNYAYSQQIYMANEIGGAGKITAITYWLMNNSNYTRNYEIYMKEVSESAFASNDAWVLLSESDKVASYALANDTDEPVAKTITLNAPFEYSGNGNLMIAIRDITGQWSDGAKGLVNDVNGNKTLYSFRDSKAYDVADPAGTGLLYAKRNVVKIDMIAAPKPASGIVDNGDGTYTVDYGTELTFVAKPAEGFMLESWSNGAPVTGDTLKLTMTEELSLTANFKHIPATITLPEGVNIVEPMPAGITSKGEGVYEVEYGTEFQISADSIPAHYHFDHWADLADSVAQYSANPRTIVAGENLTIEPIFAIDTYTLTLASNDTTMGTLSVAGAGAGGASNWEIVELTNVPAEWNGDYETLLSADYLPGFKEITEAEALTWTSEYTNSVILFYGFTEEGRTKYVMYEEGEQRKGTSYSYLGYVGGYEHVFYTTGSDEPATGKIVDNGDGTYTVDWGTELTFVAKAAEGYHVQSWSNGAEVNDLVEATQTITMTEALDLSALFAENPIITLATNDSTMGIVTLAGAGKQLTVAGSNMDVNQNIPIRPVSSTDTRTMNQSIYPAALLSGIAGESISGMTYYISEPGAHVLTATYVVKLMETEQAAFSDAVAVNTESATTVYTGTIDVTGNTLDIVFDQPYAYNGGNLLVEFSISSASHQNALAKFSVFASQGGSFQQYYNFGFEEMRYYTYDFLAKTTFICGGSKGIPGVIDLGNGQYNVLPGTELTFVAQPAERFMLDSWSNGAPVNGDSLTITVTEPLSLTANFKYIPAVITLPEGVNIVEPVPAGITAKGEGVYEVEHDTEFRISADGAPEHYHFDHWADLSAEDAQYYANPRTVVADTNFTANPFYAINTYVITLASNDTTMGQLTVEPAEGIVKNDDGTYTIDWGTEVTFVAVPAEDYHLLSWSNGAEVTEDNKQTLTVTEALSLSAFFKHDTYILTVEGVEVKNAKFADGTADAEVLNPGTLVGVQTGDNVQLTTTATFSSAAVGDNLTITVHYAIEVIDGGIYDNEYALAITDSILEIKGFILEPMTPDEDAAPEDEDTDNKEGFDIYAYGYCKGDNIGFKFHLNSGKPDQYKVEFADSRFTDVDWTDLEMEGKDGEVLIDIPMDLPTGDYSMTVTFRDSRFTWLESDPITVPFHVNLPETYVVALFDNVMAVVDTCECLTDIQWYWRADASQPWTMIEGATGYYYKQEGGLSGEYFIKAKMNGVDTYTCPQDDMTLYGDTKQAKVSAYPNPVDNATTVTIENSNAWNHNLRIVDIMGHEMMNGSFEGNSTTVDMNGLQTGHYMISVDGIVVKVMKK